MFQNVIFVGWNYVAPIKANPEPRNNAHVPLLNKDPTSIHLGLICEIIGANQPCKSSRDSAMGNPT